jgi:hypothetical protein
MQRVRSLSTSMLVGLAVMAGVLAVGGGSAQARAGIPHNVPAGGGVDVSFDLRSRSGRALLVRFPHNRVSLVRVARRRLALQSRRGRAFLRLRPRRLMRVGVRLDVEAKRITVRAGRRRLTVDRRVRHETRVIVGRGLRRVVVKALVRRPDRGGKITPGPAPAAPPSGPVRLFAPTSVWNKPLVADAALDASGAALVETLRDTVAQTDAWVQWEGTSPLYVVPAGQATTRVQLDTGSWGATLQQALRAVPIPASAVPAPGGDAHMTIYQPATDRLWELFHAQKLADGWHASWGGAIAHASRSPGYYDAASWPGLSGPHWGATATSLPVIAGTITADELRAGVIPHAVAMNVPWARQNVYTWPAQRTDGASTDPDAIPEGARFRLDPGLNINALGLRPVARMIAVAAQRYGIIVRDQTGQAVGFFTENTAQFGTDPYDGPTGLYGGTPPNIQMRSFPWQHLQVLRMDLHTMG